MLRFLVSILATRKQEGQLTKEHVPPVVGGRTKAGELVECCIRPTTLYNAQPIVLQRNAVYTTIQCNSNSTHAIRPTHNAVCGVLMQASGSWITIPRERDLSRTGKSFFSIFTLAFDVFRPLKC